jgi:DNA replication protein DnaC
MDNIRSIMGKLPKDRLAHQLHVADQLPKPVRQPVYGCHVCHDMGFTRYDVPFGHALFGKVAMCQCRRVESARDRLSKTYTWLGLSGDLAHEMEALTFAAFQPQANGREVAMAYRQARGYAEMLKGQIERQKNGLFIGPLGVGKTHLACAVMNDVRMAGIKCLFASGNELFQALFDSDFDAGILKQAAETDLLCLDDLDKMQVVKDGSYQRSALFSLLNQRYVAHKPVIITANIDDDWRKWMHPAVLSRLFGKDRVETIAMPGRDYRMIGGDKRTMAPTASQEGHDDD